PTGTTTINSDKSILEDGATGVVGGNRIALTAQTGIGTAVYGQDPSVLDHDVVTELSGTPLQVKVGPITVPFNPSTNVNLTNNTTKVGTGPGLDTGSKLTYYAKGHTAIGGLTDAVAYFARVIDATNGVITLFDTQQHAFNAGNNINTLYAGQVDLSSISGAGTLQRFTIAGPAAGAASLYATTATGNISIVQVPGNDLPIDTVKANSLGAIALTASGSISVATGYSGLVSGGAIDLFSTGGVGNSTVNPLLLDSPGASDFATDKLTVEAQTDVFLQEQSGDLRV